MVLLRPSVIGAFLGVPALHLRALAGAGAHPAPLKLFMVFDLWRRMRGQSAAWSSSAGPSPPAASFGPSLLLFTRAAGQKHSGCFEMGVGIGRGRRETYIILYNRAAMPQMRKGSAFRCVQSEQEAPRAWRRGRESLWSGCTLRYMGRTRQPKMGDSPSYQGEGELQGPGVGSVRFPGMGDAQEQPPNPLHRRSTEQKHL